MKCQGFVANFGLELFGMACLAEDLNGMKFSVAHAYPIAFHMANLHFLLYTAMKPFLLIQNRYAAQE